MRTAAVVGCGDVSVVHLEALAASPDITLTAVCDSDPAVATAVAARYGVPAYPDHRRLLAEQRPDVLHVCTPHDQHVPVVLDALDAGVHVLVEKPLAHTVAEADRLVAAAAAHPAVKVGVCFQNRYNPPVQAVRALLDSGRLGRLTGGSATVLWHRSPDYYRASPWRGQRRRSGGGVLINQAIHTVDLLQWLLGEVEQVRGQVGTYLLADQVDVEDSALLVLDHRAEDGGPQVRSVCCATVANATDAPVTLDVVTEHAALHLRGDLTVTWADGRVEVVPERRAASGGRAYWGVSHVLLIADFYARLDEPEPFWISPREARKSLRVLEQAYALGG